MLITLGRITAIFTVAWRRLIANRWLTIAELLGFVAVIALALSIPMYADAVYHRILSTTMEVTGTSATRLPAYAFMFRYVLFTSLPVALADTQPADDFVNKEVPKLLELPRNGQTRYFQTTNFLIYPSSDEGIRYDDKQEPFLRIPLTSISQFDKHVRVVDGRLPADVSSDAASQPVEVLISAELAERTGLQIGERLVAVSAQNSLNPARVPVVIAGTWEPLDSYEEYWFYRPGLLHNMLIVPENSFTQRVGPIIKKDLTEVLWLVNFDGAAVRVWDVASLTERIQKVIAQASSDTNNLNVSASPLSRLQSYQEDSQSLMARLYASSLPLFILALAFVLLVTSQRAYNLRNETAVLRSRGASRGQVLGIALVQSCILAIFAAVVAVPFAGLSAQLMGKARSFFQFTGAEWLPVSITPIGMLFGALAAALTVALTVLPMIEVSLHTIVSQKQERARSLRPPWWQRIALDLLLLIPVGYGTFLLQRQGFVDIPGLTRGAGDPFNNPSLFLIAALGMLALTMIVIRFLPLLLRALAEILNHLPGSATVLAFRQLARTPGYYSAPVLLLSLTLALAIYTSTMAATLDRQLDQETYFSVGGSARLIGTGQDNRAALGEPSQTDSSGQVNFAPDRISGRDQPSSGPRWLFLPTSDYTQVADVRTATRMGRYPLTPAFSVGANVPAQFIGVDYDQYARTAFWRRDFATEPLGALLNALGTTPNGVLAQEDVMRQHVLNVGDTINVDVKLIDTNVKLALTVVGAYRLWPTAPPDDPSVATAFVGNLDYLFEQAGGQVPYDIVLGLAGAANANSVEKQLRQIDRSDWDYRNAREIIEREQLQPQRQGLFGLLSAGVITAVALTVLGLFLYYAFSFRRRSIEFGVLRAMGFSTKQMALSLAWELATLFLVGICAGTALGFGASQLYLPLLQGPATGVTHAVRLVVITDQIRLMMVYGAISILSGIALAILLLFLRQLKIFQAIKLGETE